MKKVDYINNALATLNARNEVLISQRDKLSVDNCDSEKDYDDQIKSFNERCRENSALIAALKTDAFSSVFYSHKLDVEKMTSAMYANTREYKKRLLTIVKSISTNTDHFDKAASRVFSAIAAKRAKNKLSLHQVMNLMSHSSKTQAAYLANLASDLKFAEKSKVDDVSYIEFDLESAFMKKIIACFN